MAGRERPLPDPTAGFVCPGTEFLRQATNYEEIGLIGNGQCSAGERGLVEMVVESQTGRIVLLFYPEAP